jgi:hypothetical protein
MEATIESGKFFKGGTSAENSVLPFSAEVPTLKNFPDSIVACSYLKMCFQYLCTDFFA